MDIQVLGLCRFSYLGEGGYQTTHGTLAERRAHLYDDDRLALRFFWFERVCLPAWAAQTDKDFRLIVLTGTDFPAHWLSRLHEVCAEVPQMVIETADPGPHREVCRAVMHRHVDSAAQIVAQFRHDDDDAVAVDYVWRVRSDMTDKLRPMFRAHGLLSVDYSRGLTLAAMDGEVVVIPQMSHNLGVALTIYMRPGNARCALDYPHHRLAAHMPGVAFQDSVMFIRGKHGTNDSGDALRVGYPWRLPEAEAPGLLRDRFALDLDAFAAEFGATPIVAR